ncbi:Beta-galactosidase C-terminal domain [Actinoplanes sp. NPDC048791]|uniref:Beta-galactosidase C-terminal domain n=1 Tax=Actinoplanes sp. NPDC048791 TaxID=3154623 RepID=UPI0033C5F4E1
MLRDLLGRAGVRSELPAELRGRVELAVRGDFHFLINRTAEPVELAGLPGELLHGTPGLLEPRGVTVLRGPA